MIDQEDKDLIKNEMKEVKVIMISSLIFFLGCKNKIVDRNSQEKKPTDSVSVENTKDKAEIKNNIKLQSFKNCNETFEEFLERFGKDSILQKKRILFPLQQSYLYDNENGKDSIVEEKLSRKLYKFIDFSQDKNAWKKSINGYDVEIEKKENGIIYGLRGIDNGIREDYNFILKDNCWYLKSIDNRST